MDFQNFPPFTEEFNRLRKLYPDKISIIDVIAILALMDPEIKLHPEYNDFSHIVIKYYTRQGKT